MVDAKVLWQCWPRSTPVTSRRGCRWTGLACPEKLRTRSTISSSAIRPSRLDQFDLTPILAMTGKVVAGERERCIQAGADDYIPKPVTTLELMDAIAARLPALARPLP